MIMDSEKESAYSIFRSFKNSRGGYTTPQERSLVKYLVAKSGLPTSVINILINYVYNIQQQPTLKAEYVNRIANEWGQSGIHSPEKKQLNMSENWQNKAKPNKKTATTKLFRETPNCSTRAIARMGRSAKR